MTGLLAMLRNRGLAALMFGHLTVDSYVGVLPVLFPLLIGRFHLDLATIGLVSLAYTGVASLSQPFFGLIADRWGTRLVGGAMLWTAAWFAAIGFTPSFPLLLVAAGVAGLGSGFFHPLGALAVRAMLPPRRGNMAMSVYVSAGTVGVAIGPLLGVLVFGLLGARGTALLLLPGLACSGFLLGFMRRQPGPARRRVVPGAGALVPLVPLAATVLVMMSRSWTTMVLQSFLPTWYHLLGYQPWFYGALATTLVLSSALGTVGCGSLADRYGRRTVILVTLVLSVPAVWLFVAFPGIPGFLTAILVGLLAASTAPLTLMLAQELLAARAGFASGLIMGVGFLTGGLGVPITGAVADHIGLQAALLLQVVVVVISIPVARLLTTEKFLHRLRQPLPGTLAAGQEGASAPALGK
jgi:MFS transporter, FSR family, fosmidomycin resistance protein